MIAVGTIFRDKDKRGSKLCRHIRIESKASDGRYLCEVWINGAVRFCRVRISEATLKRGYELAPKFPWPRLG